MAVILTAFIAVVLGLTVYSVVRRVRPWLPPIVLDAAEITLPPQGVKVAWSEVTEIRVSPARVVNKRAAGRRVVAFRVTDSQDVVRRFPPH